MYSRSRERRTIVFIALAFGLILFIIDSVTGAQRELRVCAEPKSLPFSNARGEGLGRPHARHV
jgi:hypothetical protein